MIDPDSTSSLPACVSGVNSKLFVRAPGGDHKGLSPVVDGVRYGAFAWSVDDVGSCRGSLVVGPVVGAVVVGVDVVGVGVVVVVVESSSTVMVTHAQRSPSATD